MGKIIYAFPSTGKSFYCKTHSNCIELKSEKYHWLDYNEDDENEKNKGKFSIVNSEWPKNYIEAIKEAIKKYDYVFITHSGSKLCEEYGLDYYLVYPSRKSKNEIIKRMKSRGNNEELIKNMILKYESYIDSCINNEYALEKIELNEDEFLEDALTKIEKDNHSPIFDSIEENSYIIELKKTRNIFKLKTRNYCMNNKIKFAYIVFNNSFIEKLIKGKDFYEVGRFYSGSDYSSIVSNGKYLIVSSFLGGPNAVALLEELNYYGIRKVFCAGTACKIDDFPEKALLVKKAIRDEGTSLFYEKPSLYSYTSSRLNIRLENVLNAMGICYKKGITWTTDCYYREGLNRLKVRKSQGANAIDMESASFCSAAKKLDIEFSQLLFFTDAFKSGSWDKMSTNEEIKDYICSEGHKIAIMIS